MQGASRRQGSFPCQAAQRRRRAFSQQPGGAGRFGRIPLSQSACCARTAARPAPRTAYRIGHAAGAKIALTGPRAAIPCVGRWSNCRPAPRRPRLRPRTTPCRSGGFPYSSWHDSFRQPIRRYPAPFAKRQPGCVTTDMLAWRFGMRNSKLSRHAVRAHFVLRGGDSRCRPLRGRPSAPSPHGPAEVVP